MFQRGNRDVTVDQSVSSAFLLEVVPLQIQRRVVNDLVKERSFKVVVSLCAAYASFVLVQGATKLGLNVYRGWVGENAIRDLRPSGRNIAFGTRIYRPHRQMDGSGGIRSLCAAADIRAADAGCDKPPRRRAAVDFTAPRRERSRYASSIVRARQIRRQTDRPGAAAQHGNYKLKFSMNFLMNLCSHLQVVAALLIGGWMVHSGQLEVGGVVAFIPALAA